MGHIQTQEEWEVQMAEKILSYVRNELYLEMRYLDVAFSALVPQADASMQSFATDGGHLFSPQSRYCVCLRKMHRT